MSEELISIVEAAAAGIDKLRKPNWANPMDHLKIDIVNGEPGPWGHLYSPANEEINGRNPVDLLLHKREWREEKAYLSWQPN
jgi:hypothetical protein